MAQQLSAIANCQGLLSDIQALHAAGPDDTDEGKCQMVWGNICTYFFSLDQMASGFSYSVDREAERGPITHIREEIVDIAVKRIRAFTVLPDERRDVLWVECKAPSRDKPSGWKNLFNEAARRLQSAHPSRFVYFIAAVGRKAMLLAWNPTGAAGRTPLTIRSAVGNTVWTSIEGLPQ